MFEELTRTMQLQKEAGWKEPNSYPVAGTILYRPGSTLADTQFLVTTRQRGAAQGHHQAHHGGFIKPTDRNVVDAARREVQEETGFILTASDLRLLSIMGPELYRSTMSSNASGFTLTITNQQAEPTSPFIITLFVADVSPAGQVEGLDGEVNNPRWLDLDTIVREYGQSSQFNYFSFLFQAMQMLAGQRVQTFPPTEPGDYRLSL